jgi:hypothetical protein
MHHRRMSGDEGLAFAMSAFLAFIGWGRLYHQKLAVTTLGAPRPGRALLAVVPLLCVALLWATLRTLASFDVRDAPQYLMLYMVMGAAWVAAGAHLTPIAGLSIRDDVLERRNPAAATALAGAMVALTLCFAGGNIGDGPGWWVVVFSAALATGAFFLAWLVLDAVARSTELVTVDRDAAAGIRLAAFLVAAGLVLGRSVAGDWSSARDTFIDFVIYAWPLVVLIGFAAVVDHASRPTGLRPRAPVVVAGIVPALLYVAVAAAYVASLGVPE